MIEIKHSCNLRAWDYYVNPYEFLVNAQVQVDCCIISRGITHSVALHSDYVEFWFTSKQLNHNLTIWVKVDLDGYRYAGIEQDPRKNGRYFIQLERIGGV